MTELRPLDAGFIELEDSDRHVSLGIAAVAILSGTPPAHTEFVAALADRVAANDRLRQRMRRAPLDLTAPVWEDDPNFDLAHHIRWCALPAPADEPALREFVATALIERLDRDHPLWECVVVDHLAGERWAMILKVHHSLADGISGVTLFESLCDDWASHEPAEPDSGTADRRGRFDWAVTALRLPVDVPRYAVGMVRSLAPLAAALVSAPAASSLNGPIGRQRRYAIARASLTEIREIGREFDATVNDVVLAAVTAAYRTVLLSRGEDPTGNSVRILVPVSVRTADAKAIVDNRVSAVMSLLPLHLEDPVERLTTIHRRMVRHKSSGAAQAEKSLIALAGRVPFAPVAWSLRLWSRLPQRGVTAVATNIPGPRRALRMLGRDVLELLPAVPIAMRLRTGIAILSYGDQLAFGITGDYDTTADLEVLADGIQDAIADLLATVRAGSQRRAESGLSAEEPRRPTDSQRRTDSQSPVG
ncbi:wax ester/triacylglycerol synthase family O-acyltransferase [Nocardia seriolae]|uniref:wax ester/triacylglycerol synthase family O-acyltransferase n=1 Tax=Nocardia seriolae TaxID=37332 RepID=UPI00118EAC5F|nr:wax ester/triacylglycerol synthase family O-acyltransferase [Nocardia seriolae]GEM26259.1 diacylglycerol O-acyltransferase [Nocardia seriolae NBRC 15557]